MAENKVEKIGSQIRRYLSGGDVTIEKRAKDGAAAGDVDELVIKGYALKFEQRSELMCGQFYEIIDKDALIGTDMSDTVCLYNHNMNYLLGRVSSQTLTLTIDSFGLLYECRLPSASFATDLKESIDRRDITGSSFSFVAKTDEYTDLDDGKWIRRIKEISIIYDVGPVIFPAYKQTEVRSMPETFEQYLQGKKEDGKWLSEYEARQAIINNTNI